jgi:hypothetical protein
LVLVAEAIGGVMGLYEKLGFTRAPVVTLGKRL